MEENPYGALAALLGVDERPVAFCLGTVTSWPTAQNPGRPHKLITQGNTQEREDLRADPALLPYGLTDGDEVLLAPVEEGQRYIVICKVVEV